MRQFAYGGGFASTVYPSEHNDERVVRIRIEGLF
jgi:hypothetical protein